MFRPVLAVMAHHDICSRFKNVIVNEITVMYIFV